MTAKEFFKEAKENRALLAKMTPENRKFDEDFYTSLLEVTRLADKDGRAQEEILENVRSDIFSAQAQGISAESYFGMSAPELARHFIEEMPEKSPQLKSRRKWGMPLYFLIIFALIYLTPWFGGGLNKRGLGAFGLLFIFNLIGWWISAYFPSWAFKLYPDKTAKERQKICNYFEIGFAIFFVAIVLLVMFLLPKP